MAQVGMRLRVWWAGEARWFTGTVGAARREGFDVCYDDGDVRLTNLHTALWQELPPIRRSSTERWPASEAEAVQRDWKGFPIACARPGAKLQTYGRDGMRGLGVRVAPQAKALLLPSAAGKGRTAQLLGRRLFWFEGDIFTGPNAERAAVAALAGNDGAPTQHLGSESQTAEANQLAIRPINVRRRHLSEVRGSSSMHKQSSNMHNMCSTSHASTVTCYCTYYKLHDITITLLPLHTPDFVSSRPRHGSHRRGTMQDSGTHGRRHRRVVPRARGGMHRWLIVELQELRPPAPAPCGLWPLSELQELEGPELLAVKRALPSPTGSRAS